MQAEMSSIQEFQQQQQEIAARLEALRSLRQDYARDVTATIRPAKALSDLDRRIVGTEHRLSVLTADLARAEEEEGCERAVREADELKRLTVEALQLYIAWYGLSLQAEDARLLWCAARSAVPGGLAEMPLMSSEYIAEWAADRLVELGAVEDLPAVEVADLAALP